MVFGSTKYKTFTNLGGKFYVINVETYVQKNVGTTFDWTQRDPDTPLANSQTTIQ